MKQLLLITIGLFILAMSVISYLEIRNGYRQASELERYLMKEINE